MGNLISEDKYTLTTTGMDWQNAAAYVYNETNRMVDGKNEQGEHNLYTYDAEGNVIREYDRDSGETKRAQTTTYGWVMDNTCSTKWNDSVPNRFSIAA